MEAWNSGSFKHQWWRSKPKDRGDGIGTHGRGRTSHGRTKHWEKRQESSPATAIDAMPWRSLIPSDSDSASMNDDDYTINGDGDIMVGTTTTRSCSSGRTLFHLRRVSLSSLPATTATILPFARAVIISLPFRTLSLDFISLLVSEGVLGIWIGGGDRTKKVTVAARGWLDLSYIAN
ncbi:hypothetical protein PIB30_027324 [Stylosanthes scabra]|uniref:Uncharacterized protein n=1 Tax=Stylosanthes scabra TaxID=79078 RepID=A0ABU6QA55_9FABA|nr:hypothetical protein [Stylosanthes scabra]